MERTCSASDIQGDTPGSASSGLSEAHRRSGSAAPTCASLAQGKRKRLWAGASPELGKKRARGAPADPASGRSEDYEEMTLKALRDLADKTPGITNRKKVGKKWVYKEKEELVEEFKELKAKKGAQPLAGPKTDLDKRVTKKARQAS